MLTIFTKYEINEKEIKKVNAEIERVKKEIYKSGCKDVKLINQYSRLVDKMIKLM
jgi:hypothetical protein